MHLSKFADLHLGDEPGADLTMSGPASSAIAEVISDKDQAAFLLATIFWKSFVDSYAFEATLSQEGFSVVNARLGKQVIIYHGPPAKPRFDLLILDPQYPLQRPYTIKSIVTLPNILRIGSEKLLESWLVEEASLHLKKIGKYVTDAVIEISKSQRFGIVITQQPKANPGGGPSGGPIFPRIPIPSNDSQNIPVGVPVFTAYRPSPSWIVRKVIPTISTAANQSSMASVGVIAEDNVGRQGVTTALHAIEPPPSSVYSTGEGLAVMTYPSPGNPPEFVLVNGKMGRVVTTSKVQDSCFIIVDIDLGKDNLKVNSPMKDRGPGPNELVTFEGAASGKVETTVIACDLGIPFWIDPTKQLTVYTKAVTKLGDSGAALVNRENQVVGFAHQRIGGEMEYSDWIWANSVFHALWLLAD